MDIRSLRIRNIGIIRSADIDFSGITVITGLNDSGKSTIGKVLYSLCRSDIELVNDLRAEKAAQVNELSLILNSKHLDRRYDQIFHLSSNPSAAESGFDEFSPEEQDEFISQWIESLNDEIDSNLKTASGKDDEDVYPFSLARATVKRLESILHLGGKGNLANYRNSRFRSVLDEEMSGQILPLRDSSSDGFISFEDNFSKQMFAVELKRSGDVVFLADKGCHSTLLSSVSYVDDASVLDTLPRFGFAINGVNDHRSYLAHKLLDCRQPDSTLGSMIVEDRLSNVMNIVSSAVPGSYVHQSGKDYYKVGNSLLALRNLATGAKSFMVLKMLLESGQLDDGGLLILDEPEAHLHPDWINVMARFLISLHKEMGINIVMTTQSANMVLALDAYGKEMGMRDDITFYSPKDESEDEKMVTFKKDDDMRKVYSHLTLGYEEAFSILVENS